MRVITTLLCRSADPQRGFKWPAEFSRYLPWAESVRRYGHRPVVLTDTGREYPGLEVVQVEPGENPYFHRWAVIADYLADFYAHDLVWCTDGTDVVMLHDPEPAMNAGPFGQMYAGADIYPVGCDWMRHTCPGFEAWIANYGDMMLLNAGLFGGPAWAVRSIARQIADEWPCEALHDMAAFNMTLQDLDVSTDSVNTRMHDWDHSHPTAWFAHK